MVFEILIGLRMEASTTNVVRKLVLLWCKSTQLVVRLHHEDKLYSTCLVVNESLVLWLLATCVVLQASLTSFYVNGSPMLTCLWYLICVFTQEVASDSTQITVATWIRRLPKEWSSRTLSRQSQLLCLPLTQQTQTIQYCYQRKRTAHMEPLQRVSFRRLWSSAKSIWSVLYPLGK